MDDDIVLLGGYTPRVSPFGPFSGFNSQSMYSSAFGGVRGRSISDTESSLLAGSEFSYARRRRSLLSRTVGAVANTFSLGITDMATGSRRNDLERVSRGVTLRGVSQEDYTSLANLDLFRGGRVSDVSDTEISQATYKQDRVTGQVARTKGDALSLLDEAGLESLAEVVSARNSQIVGNALSPGLAAQSLGLLGG